MSILLTGATGFLGQAIAEALTNKSLIQVQRKPVPENSDNKVCITDFNQLDNHKDLFKNVSVLIHCAAMVHLFNKEGAEFLEEYRHVNTSGTINLAKAAANAGAKRFIFISSIGVNGTVSSQPLTESSPTQPYNNYTQSKYEAELELLELSKGWDMDVVIIRPPIIYGPKPPGNFFSLIKWVKGGIPLPLGCVSQNKRSMVALENLVDFILHCADYEKTPKAANEVFLISDNEDVSTAGLLQKVAKAYQKKLLLLPIPTCLLRFGAKVLGKQRMAESLLDSLQIDCSKAQNLLQWQPKITMDEQLKRIAERDIY